MATHILNVGTRMSISLHSRTVTLTLLVTYSSLNIWLQTVRRSADIRWNVDSSSLQINTVCRHRTLLPISTSDIITQSARERARERERERAAASQVGGEPSRGLRRGHRCGFRPRRGATSRSVAALHIQRKQEDGQTRCAKGTQIIHDCTIKRPPALSLLSVTSVTAAYLSIGLLEKRLYLRCLRFRNSLFFPSLSVSTALCGVCHACVSLSPSLHLCLSVILSIAYIYIYIYICIHIYICTYAYTYIHVCMCVCMYVCM